MSEFERYQQWEARRKAASIAQTNVILNDARQTNPDEFAGDVQLGRAFNIPAGVATEGRDMLRSRLSSKMDELRLSQSPMLMRWLRDPDNARAAHDDLSNLSVLESFGRQAKEAIKALPASPVATIGSMAEGVGQWLTPRDPADRLPLTNSIASARKKTPEEIGALRQQIFNQGIVNPATAQSVLSDVLAGDMTPDEALQALEPLFTPALEVMSKGLQTGGEKTQDYAETILPAAPGMENSFGREIGAGLGSMLTLLGIGLVTGGATWPAIAGAAGGAGEATARARKAGQDEDTQTIAALYGILPGLTDAIPIERLISNPVTKRGLGHFLRSLGVQAAQEGGQEAVQQLLQNMIAQNLYAPDEELMADLARSFQVGGFTGALVEAGRIGLNAVLPGRLRNRQAAAQAAPQTVEQLDKISQAAQASKLRTRLDSSFADFVDRATDGTPVENVFIPADKMQEYFQSAGFEPDEFLAELPGVTRADYDQALATGGDLKIPTGTYAAKLAGSEFDPFLRENMRFDPDAMTLAEAQAFNEQAADAVQEAYEQAEQLRQEDEALRSDEQMIYDEIVSRLRVAGRSTDVATNEAMLWPAFYRTMAARSELTTEEMLQAFPLPKIEGVRPEGLQPKNVDEFNRTLAELRKRSGGERPRESLLEFIDRRGGINDPGGELAARDAAVVRRGRGRKTLKLRRGLGGKIKDLFGGDKSYSLDDVARSAVEEGFMADDPRVQAYINAAESGEQAPDITAAFLEAIDRELAGNTEYAQDAFSSRERARAEALDQAQEWLAKKGISLEDSDDAIRAAIDEAERADGRRYEQPGDKGPAGSIQFPSTGIGTGDTIISLFEKANLSTFIHETGHMFLSINQAMAGQENAPAAVVKMNETIKAWWRANAADVAKDASRMSGIAISAEDVERAVDTGTAGDATLDQAIDVGMQEQFARGFEAYVMEGKAPSVELRGAFERFRAWLLNIYKRLAGLGVNVSPELRGVFDRMLATDAEIEQASASVHDQMMFENAIDAGISEEDYRALTKLHQQAQEDSAQRLLKETMAPIRRAREQWFKDERAKVRDEVAGQINARKEYRAVEWLGNRRWLGEGQPEAMPDMRMSKDMLVERYGEGVLKTLPRGKFPVYAVEGGMDPDEVAGWFGFGSGDQLVRALETAPARKDAIEAETDRVMRERHGDVLRDGSVEEAALAAVHGDKRGQFLAAELRALRTIAGDTSPDLSMQTAREMAKRSMARMQVRDAMRSGRYLAAERRAAAEAIALARIVAREGVLARAARREVGKTVRSVLRAQDGRAVERINAKTDAANEKIGGLHDNVSKLIDAKRRQLINHALYSESLAVTEEVEKAERFVAKLGKVSTRSKLAGDYLDAIDEVLDRYDFRKLSGRDETRRGSLASYIQRMIDEGRANELAIPDYVIAESRRTPYKRLSVEYLRGVVDTLKNIEHTARLKRTLLDAKGKRDLDAVVDDILDAFDANMKQRPIARAKGARGTVRKNIVDYLNLIKNADTMLREVDGFKDGGATYRNIKSPIDDAMAELTISRREAADKFDKLYSVYSKEERRAMTVLKFSPDLLGSFSKWDLISIALNTGNEGNFQRLTDQRVQGSFHPDQVERALQSLDERDWKFVQSAWDMIDSYWSAIEARERRVTGVAPEKIAPRAVETRYGTFRGGYYPLKYDAEISSLARDDDLIETSKSMLGGRFGKAQTRNGHLKERASSSGRPVLVDIGVMHGHINQVVHDLALSEVVKNSWKILQDRRVHDAFIGAGAKSDFDTLEAWLLDVASGEMRSGDFMNRWARRLKSGFTVSKLAFNLKTVLLQPTSISQSMVVVGKKQFLLGVQDMFRRPLMGPGSAANAVIEKSVFMRERETTFNKDIYDMLGDTRTGPTQNPVSAFVRDVVAPLGFLAMQKTQFYTVDLPTWLAGYRKAIDEGSSEADAVSAADRVVARAQASGHFSDRTAIERGTLAQNVRQNDVVRLFTALASYMFAKFNVAYERTQTARRGIDGFNPKSAGQVLLWSFDMAMLFTVEGVMFAAMTGALPGMGDDDEDDDGWLEFMAKQTALSIAGTLPFIRDGASSVQGYSGGGAYGSVVETIARPIFQASQGEFDKAFVKSVIDTSGLFLMLPSTQVNRVVDAAWRQSDGEDVSPAEYLMGRNR